jgi:hypothetical protein
MRRRFFLSTGLLLAAPALAQPRQALPHEWVFGSWLGGQFPPGEIGGQECLGGATVIFLRDVVLRATALDVAYRQRLIETVAPIPDGLEFRFVPAGPVGGAFGNRPPPDAGFGCEGDPNLLRVRRRTADEIIFPGCNEFPSPLRRCRPA